MEMETPSWMRHFNNKGPAPGPSGSSGNIYRSSNGSQADLCSTPTEKNWTLGPSEKIQCSSGHGNSGYDSFNDIDRTSGGSQYIPRIRSVQSCDNVAEQEKKTKKRRRRRPADETSGYSTTSLSELSEFESPRRKNHNNRNKRRESIQDDRSDKSRQSRLSNITSKSDISKVPSSRKMSETSRGTTSPRESVSNLQRPLSALSIAESVRSEASLQSGRSNHTSKSRQTNRTSASTLPHKGSRLSINTDPSVDPFYFIQPVPETFSSKVRKSMGPIFGIFVMIILAASLGAAIYFAVELKKTHEDEIEMLRANLNLKITNARFSDDLNLDELSPTDFNSLSLKYCQQMDRFYKRSESFKNTYRGCEVISIRNENINFTLFFVDKGEKATQRDIISVIKTSAPKVQESGKSIALVDKFEIELDNVKIKIEHKREPASFNKIIEKETVPPPVRAPPQIRTTTESTTFETSVNMSENTTTTKAPSTVTVTTKTTTTSTKATRKPTTTTKRPQPLVNQQESLKAWEPCGQLDGTFFQHPIECNKYFQCEHKKSLLQTCTGDLVFDNRSNVCVPHRPGVICPDPKIAPPKPISTTTSATTTAVLTTKPSVSNSKNRSTIPNYPSRPVYAREPCAKGKVGSLYPHPDDCSKFIQCITGGTGVISTCAGDLVYDPEQQTCVYQRNELVCPDIIPCKNMERGYFPHPFNCSLYIQCQSGKEIVQKCANGLVWDPSVNGCMFKTVSSVCPEDFS